MAEVGQEFKSLWPQCSIMSSKIFPNTSNSYIGSINIRTKNEKCNTFVTPKENLILEARNYVQNV